jgi:hypothetical protein
LVINKLSDLLKDKAVGSIADRALLLSYQAAYEKKPDKAINAPIIFSLLVGLFAVFR